MDSRTSPLIAIVGPTASGKTSLAISLAERFGGEIICADSRTIYKELDIGTAKPTREERARVPHWGVDTVEPGERFTAADFKRYANEAITAIRARGNIPFLVGGTGLYVDAVVFDFNFGGKVNSQLRARLNELSIEALHKYCNENNITLPENTQNKRYVIRTIERHNVPQQINTTILSNTHIVGISTEIDTLRTRIEQRAEQLFDNNVVEEATRLGKKYGWNNEAMTGNIYPLVRKYNDGELSYEEMKQKFITLDWRLAKRQRTWLRRNPHIVWKSLSEAERYITDVLAETK